MKKSILAITGCAMLLLISSFANSAEGPYVSGNLGLAIPRDSDVTDSTLPGITLDIASDSGLAVGGAVGYGIYNNRFEGEITYHKNDLDKASLFGADVNITGDTSCLALLLNGYLDFMNETAYTSFITAGLGFAKIEINDFYVPGSGLPSESDDDTVFAYQVGAGVGYAVNEKITIDVKYRYFATADLEFDTTTVEYSGHNFLAGMRVRF
jgi:opacity protein-like surface antigen